MRHCNVQGEEQFSIQDSEAQLGLSLEDTIGERKLVALRWSQPKFHRTVSISQFPTESRMGNLGVERLMNDNDSSHIPCGFLGEHAKHQSSMKPKQSQKRRQKSRALSAVKLISKANVSSQTWWSTHGREALTGSRKMALGITGEFPGVLTAPASWGACVQ